MLLKIGICVNILLLLMVHEGHQKIAWHIFKFLDEGHCIPAPPHSRIWGRKKQVFLVVLIVLLLCKLMMLQVAQHTRSCRKTNSARSSASAAGLGFHLKHTHGDGLLEEKESTPQAKTKVGPFIEGRCGHFLLSCFDHSVLLPLVVVKPR